MRNIPRAHKSIHRAGVWGRATFVLRSFDPVSPISQPNVLCPIRSVEGAILNRFAQMFGQNALSAFEVRVWARYFQDTVVRTCRWAEPLNGRFEQLFSVRRNRA